MVNQDLQVLQEEGVCDVATVKRLSKNDPFLQQRIAKVLEQFNNSKEETVNSLGGKLLFLEEMLAAPKEQQKKVREWLQDEKRVFLFDYSLQGQLYGRLLLAKADGSLEALRAKFNPAAVSQQPYTFDKQLKLEHVIDESATDLLELKEKAVLDAIREKEIGPLQHALNRCFELDYLKALMAKGPKTEHYERERKIENPRQGAFKKLAFQKFVDDEKREAIFKLLEGMYDHINPKGPSPFPENLEEFVAEKRSEVDKIMCASEKGNLALLEIVQQYLTEDIDEPLGDILPDELHRTLTREECAELIAIKRQKYELSVQRKLSDKIGRKCKLEYSVELSAKDPLDIRFGNDSGACIGVFENKKEVGNAYGLPAMIADNATYILTVHQRINNGVKRRVGMILAFETRNEKNERVLTCNSLEMSASMTPKDVVEPLVTYCEDAIIDFGRRNGFAAAIMSDHHYNTSQNYSKRRKKLFKGNLKKVRRANEPPFYSEVLTTDGRARTDTDKTDNEARRFGCYVLYDDRQ